MEHLIDSQHGPTALIACLVVSVALLVLTKVGEFIFSIFTKKSEGVDQQIMKIGLALTENTQAVRELKIQMEQVNRIDLALTANTQAMRELKIQMQLLEREMATVGKLNGNVQELFSGLRFLSDKKWPAVRKAMKEDVALK